MKNTVSYMRDVIEKGYKGSPCHVTQLKYIQKLRAPNWKMDDTAKGGLTEF